MAEPGAPKTVPGLSGESPQTAGPVVTTGARSAALVKNDRTTEPTLRRLLASRIEAPFPRPSAIRLKAERGEGGASARSR